MVPVHAANETNRYSIIFGWKTDGSHELLARQASAFKTYRDDRSLAISFGSLLGTTLIVRHDTADQFLSSAREAGYNYIIPGASEFMFGVETAVRFSENDRYPRFISANLVDAKTRRTLFEPYATWYVSGLRICIIAFSDTSISKQIRGGTLKGIDIMTYDETLNALSVPVAREHADIVIAAGRFDRAAVFDIARKHPYVDMFLTNSQSGGFADAKGATTNALVSGKSLFVGSEEGTKLGMLALKEVGGIETREFSTITLGVAFPPDKELFASLNRTLEEFKRRDTEETAVQKTATSVTNVLKDIFGVSAVFLHRQSLFYYPLKDSLTIFNVRNIIRPYEKLTRYEVKGSVLTSVLSDLKSRKEPDDRLIFAGLNAEGRIDSLPVVADSTYVILTTSHLRAGGNGYVQFQSGTNESIADINMLTTVEDYLVAKDERLRRLARKKEWALVTNLQISANMNRIDVDRDKTLYKSIPAPFGSLKDQFMGYFGVTSRNNSYTFQHKRHSFSSVLDMDYRRQGARTPSGDVLYSIGTDVLRFANRYEYRIPSLPSVPYIELILTSSFHPPPGKHPIRADMSTGLSRRFPRYWTDVSIGLNGTRDYVTNRNNLGTNLTLNVNKTFPARRLLTAPSTLTSKSRVFWAPSAQSRSMFRHENENSFAIQLWKKVGMSFQVNTYSYRDNSKDKVAAGFQYLVNLTYGMQWKL